MSINKIDRNLEEINEILRRDLNIKAGKAVEELQQCLNIFAEGISQKILENQRTFELMRDTLMEDSFVKVEPDKVTIFFAHDDSGIVFNKKDTDTEDELTVKGIGYYSK